VTISLLVLGTRDDDHVDVVATKLAELGRSVCVADHNHPPTFSITQGPSGVVQFCYDEYSWDSECRDFVVWNRSKLWWGSPVFFGRSFADQPSYDDADTLRSLLYLAEEWQGVYRVLMSFFADRTLNRPSSVFLGNKLLQQREAASCGFRIPESISTNDKNRILAFIDDNCEVVMKSLAGARMIPRREMGEVVPTDVMTMDVDRASVQEADETEFRAGPSFFQSKISKDHELRIVVVDGEMFTFAIPSQDFEHTRTDWRYGNDILSFTPCALPDRVAAGVRTLMASLGLAMGSVDLIVDRSGDYWFLEVNPEGAWGWLDPLVSGRISDSVACLFDRRIRGGDDAELG